MLLTLGMNRNKVKSELWFTFYIVFEENLLHEGLLSNDKSREIKENDFYNLKKVSLHTTRKI